MADVPSFENTTASLVNKVLKFAIDSATTAAKAALIVQFPWLGWPIISWVFGWAFNWVSGFFYTFLAEHSTFMIIDFQTMEEKNAYLASMDALRAAQAGGNADAIEAARIKAKEDLAKLIRFDGSATP